MSLNTLSVFIQAIITNDRKGLDYSYKLGKLSRLDTVDDDRMAGYYLSSSKVDNRDLPYSHENLRALK